MQGSGKLQVLQHLLDVLLGLHKRAIIAAHESMGVLCDYLTLKYGERAFHKISDETMALDRDRAIADFNNSSKPQDLLVLEVSACSLGTDFKTADAVIIYDSDGHPASDIQRFGHARSMGDASKLLVYRLYCAGTLEEVIVAVSITSLCFTPSVCVGRVALEKPLAREVIVPSDCTDLRPFF